MSTPLTGKDLDDFVAAAEEGAVAYVRDDMDRYLEVVHHADEFTLMPPYGGPAGRHERRDDEVRASTGFIQDGDARLEHVETHVWGDTLVMAMVERQHGRVQGRADQDISLRVTHVYRREGDDWKLVHRHADAMVDEITIDDLLEMQRQ